MAMTLSDDDARACAALQQELTTVLLRANAQRVEAAVAVIALCRCARILLDRYSPNVREALCTVIVAFLRHETVEIEGEGGLLN